MDEQDDNDNGEEEFSLPQDGMQDDNDDNDESIACHCGRRSRGVRARIPPRGSVAKPRAEREQKK
jgi:hypothetical protein